MDRTRLTLVAALVIHKLVWEVMKDRRPIAAPSGGEPRRGAVRAIKVAFLGGLLVQTLFLNLLPIPHRPRAVRALGLALCLTGLGVALTGRIQLGPNWASLEDQTVKAGQSLTTGGIYRYIRHPIYIGDTLLVTGLQLALNSWLFLLGLPLLALVNRQASIEEGLLAAAFPAYDEYRQRTKRFIPGVY